MSRLAIFMVDGFEEIEALTAEIEQALAKDGKLRIRILGA